MTASRPLVWAATGYRFENVGTQSTSEPGSEVVLTLPRTDVQGWKDGRSGAILDVSAEGAYSHRYIAQVRYLDEAGRSIGVPFTIGPFVLPEGDGVLDLDTTVPASTVAGDAVSVPDSWGADVVAARAAAEAAEAALASIGQATVAPEPQTVARRTGAGTLKTAAPVDDDDAVSLGVARDSFAPTTLVRDIRGFLLPGETLDPTGQVDMSAILQRAWDTLAVEYAAQTPTLGRKLPYQVSFPAGRFKATDINVLYKSGVGIVGQGPAQTTFLPFGNTAFLHGFTGDEWVEGQYHDDLVFTGFTVDCANQSSGGYNHAMKGMFIQHMRRARWERVHIHNSWATGFGCDFLEDSVLVDCVASNAGRGVPPNRNGTGAGFGIGNGGAPNESVTLINCLSFNNYSHGFFIEHLNRPEALYSSRGFSMVGCIGKRNWHGLFEAGGNGSTYTGCHFVDNEYAGVILRGTGASKGGGKDVLISGGTISGNGAQAGGGVILRDVAEGGLTLSDVLIFDNAGPGVWAPTGALVGTGITVKGCKIKNNAGAGIRLDVAAVDLSVVGNEILGNAGDGVRLAASTGRLRVVDNVARRNAGYGLALAGAAEYASGRPRITGNRFVENVAGGLLNEQAVDNSADIRDNITTATPTNLLSDPSFETTTTGATSLNATLTRPNVGAAAHSGSYVLRGTYSGTGGSGYGVITTTGAVTGGVVVRGVAWVKALPGRVIYPTLNTGSPSLQIIGAKQIATGGWQRIEIEGVVSAGKTTARVGCYVDTNAAITTGEVIDMDDVELMIVA
ncbi:right-handed parallel beta-helix repeat-containing protein [Cellulomonas sp. KH9]|uniref:right-handed parallel beta-helix repeat-containing protein n=1 Tax=Cellulomonas sp. KH9 TaxID=1855324 RepID=UPI001160C3B1|nr:right-handed parallel beta-helix repeat-containing protein [Cellulomonas sp. KH9]